MVGRTAVGGTLECSPSGGVVLRLLDAIDPPSTEGWSWSPTEDDTYAEVIWGATFEGPREVTLLDCESPGQPVPREAAALQSQTFRARWALFGIHAEESNQNRCIWPQKLTPPQLSPLHQNYQDSKYSRAPGFAQFGRYRIVCRPQHLKGVCDDSTVGQQLN